VRRLTLRRSLEERGSGFYPGGERRTTEWGRRFSDGCSLVRGLDEKLIMMWILGKPKA